MKWLGAALMAAGVVLIATLYIGSANKEKEQRHLVESFQQMAIENVEDKKVGAKKGKPDSEEPALLKENSEAVGILTVPKLDMELPVVDGAGAEQLARALGAIPGLDEPGQMDGSYAIAGHRSSIFGQYFNRLDEVEKGDLVQLQTADQPMTFKVYDTKIVKPEQVEVLQPEKGKAKLSLVTCHPENSSKYRLIVEAERVE